tara:strand:- start:47121 stop:47381 length:261 start_codon:yes stop_codon:yes gene_type:complete
MKHWISVCKNVIASNNKRGWKDPQPSIRVATAKYGKVVTRSNRVGITDKDGNVVAEIVATTDGEPVIGCGAKVGLITEFETVDLES